MKEYCVTYSCNDIYNIGLYVNKVQSILITCIFIMHQIHALQDVGFMSAQSAA